MNIRIILILSLLVTLTLPNIGFSADGRLCQKGVYVIFVNGIWSTPEDGRRLIESRLEAKVSGTSLEGVITYVEANNPTAGMYSTEDLLEAF
jgi:hypothetical protein